MLLKDKLIQARKIIHDDKHHIVFKLGAKVMRVPGPIHLIKWIEKDRNCCM